MLACKNCGRPSDNDLPYNIYLDLNPCINCGGAIIDECKLPAYTIKQWEIWKASFKNWLHDFKPWEFNEDGTTVSGAGSPIRKYWNISKNNKI